MASSCDGAFCHGGFCVELQAVLGITTLSQPGHDSPGRVFPSPRLSLMSRWSLSQLHRLGIWAFLRKRLRFIGECSSVGASPAPLRMGDDDVSGDDEWVTARRHQSRPHMKEKLCENIGFQKEKDPRVLFRPEEGLTVFFTILCCDRSQARTRCLFFLFRSAVGALFDPDAVFLWLVQVHEILSQQSQSVSFGQADGRHSQSVLGIFP